MWEFVLRFGSEWFSRPSGVTTLGIAAGLGLFLVGVIGHVPRDRKIGLLVAVVCLIAGIVAYFLG